MSQHMEENEKDKYITEMKKAVTALRLLRKAQVVVNKINGGHESNE